MVVVRRRLIFWLIKAYIKKWRKTALFFFLFGILSFFLIMTTAPFIVSKIPVGKKESIGIVGAYKLENLPPTILEQVSHGLTAMQQDGNPKPDVAKEWKVSNDGKAYTFILKTGLRFSDGSTLTSKDITYNFAETHVERPDKNTIIFKLKDSFAPFLATAVSRPILKNGYIGVGNYKIQDIKLNGTYLETLTLASVKNQYDVKYYQFYPSFSALKTAYALGEISKAEGLPDITYNKSSFSDFKNTNVTKVVDYSQLVTLFFNTKDSNFSNEKLRTALSYALPENFSQGKKSYFSYPKTSWAYPEALAERKQDLDRAKLLLTETGSKSAELTMTLKTLAKHKSTAEEIKREWEKIDVKTTIEVIDSIPTQYQMFLGEFNVPKDPDQYRLWHADQETNITRYADLRIDKLLEDGRKTNDQEKRKKIYEDFQKYLIADTPAAFLYFPYEYQINKK